MPRWVGRAIGLDVHREFCEVAICEDGKTRSAGRVPATPEGITALAESLVASDRVALEVTGSCWEVARILEPHVNRVVVVSPDDTGIASARAKTDKLDARALASLLWKGELEAVWMPDERCRILRRRLSRREQLVHVPLAGEERDPRGVAAEASAQAAVLGPVRSQRPPLARGLELPPEERESVDAGIRHVEFLDAEIAAVEKLIAQQALSWPEIRRLMTVPGVNLICAASFIAAVGNPNRFMTSRKLVAYLGLDPRVKQSGEGPGAQRPDLKTRLPHRRAGRSSKPRGQRCSSPARCTPSTSAPSAAADTAKRSSRPPASSPSCSGACSPAAEDYAHQQPSLTRKKLRRLEITAGAPKYTRRAKGIWSTNDLMRTAELELARQAETSYKRMVQDQQAAGPARKAGASVTLERA